jgi:hypothetical protein
MPPLIDATKRKFLHYHLEAYLEAVDEHRIGNFLYHTTTKYVKNFGYSDLRSVWAGLGTGMYADEELDRTDPVLEGQFNVISKVACQSHNHI